MPYSLPTPSTLNDVFAMNPGAFSQAQQFMQGGVQQNDQDLQASQLRNMFDSQMNPLRVQGQDLNNQTTLAQLPGVQANSAIAQRTNSNQDVLNDDTLQAAKTKFAAQATQAHLDELAAKAQEMAYSDDPAVQAQGQKLMLAHKDIVTERAKQDEMQQRQIALEKLRGQNQKELAQTYLEGGRWKKGAGSAQDALDKALTSGSWDKASTAYDAMAQQAMQSGDTTQANYYAQKAKEYGDKYLQSRNAPRAGGVDVGSMPGMNIPVQPTPTTQLPALPTSNMQGPGLNAQDIANGAQFSSPEVEAQVRANAQRAAPQSAAGALPAAAEAWVQKAMALNPGMSRADIIAQGKKKGKF